MPIVTDQGFADDVWTKTERGDTPGQRVLAPLPVVAADPSAFDFVTALGVALPNDAEAADAAPFFERLSLISIHFPSFADGRGFSLARRLRALGFNGCLRAEGHVIADQYAYARACGFDEVEISDALAARQPQEHWIAVRENRALAYQRGYGAGASILDARRSARLSTAAE